MKRDFPTNKEGGNFRGQTEDCLRKVIQFQSVLLNAGTLQEKLKRITDAVVEIFDADFACIWLLRPGDLCEAGCTHATASDRPHACCDRERCLHLLASSGRCTNLDGEGHRRVPIGCNKIGRIAAAGAEPSFLSNDIAHDPQVYNHEWAAALGLVSFAGYRLQPPNGETCGVLALFSTHPIQPDEDALLDRLSGIAAQAIQQARAEEKLRLGEQLGRNLAELLPHRIFVKDLDSVYVACNSNYAHDLGIEPGQVAGKDDFVFHPRELAESYRADDQAVMTSGMMKDIEEEYVVHGERRWVHTIKVPYCNERGDVSGVLGIFEEISGRKRAEAELNQERNLLCALMDHSDDSIYFKDLESRFLRCSAALMLRFQAKGLSNVIGKTDHDFFSDEHADDALRDEREIIRTGEALTGKVEKETWPDGRIAWVLTSKMPLRNESGGIIGTFGVSKDITALKEAEEKLDILHRQLVEASREAGKAEVASSVLHNIGNVLNSVNVSSSLIAEKVCESKVSSLPKVVALLRAHESDLPAFLSDDPKGRKLPVYLGSLAVRLAEEQAEILAEIETMAGGLRHIKEVLSLQQGFAKTLGIAEILPVADLVEDALRLNLGALERHGIELVREYAPVPPISVEKHKVLQILVNLIRNAKYACDDSGRTDKRIILRIAKGKGRVRISVEDNGIGIAPENLVRIFGHGFTTRKEGHGFGLHSGALEAKELGGSLGAFSEGPGKGAVFTLELPLKPAKGML